MPSNIDFQSMSFAMQATANREYLQPTYTEPSRGLYYRAVRWGFMRFHKRSMTNRYFYSLRYRLKCFPGSASYYLLGLI